MEKSLCTITIISNKAIVINIPSLFAEMRGVNYFILKKDVTVNIPREPHVKWRPSTPPKVFYGKPSGTKHELTLLDSKCIATKLHHEK